MLAAAVAAVAAVVVPRKKSMPSVPRMVAAVAVGDGEGPAGGRAVCCTVGLAVGDDEMLPTTTGLIQSADPGT